MTPAINQPKCVLTFYDFPYLKCLQKSMILDGFEFAAYLTFVFTSLFFVTQIYGIARAALARSMALSYFLDNTQEIYSTLTALNRVESSVAKIVAYAGISHNTGSNDHFLTSQEATLVAAVKTQIQFNLDKINQFSNPLQPTARFTLQMNNLTIPMLKHVFERIKEPEFLQPFVQHILNNMRMNRTQLRAGSTSRYFWKLFDKPQAIIESRKLENDVDLPLIFHPG
ncbi:MAG: hypothetical protein ABL898_07725 [Hyphomicrobiaceae bacterium]